jgi:DNA repair protein RadA/Sms
MDESGLEAVENASAIFLADRIEGSSGSAVTALVEGSRPILIEVQGLATMAAYGSPQRLATGYDRRRLAILAAILEKRAGFHCSQYDLFANIVGGITMADPAGDAALAVALTSSAYNRAVPAHTIFLGEIGLSGEIRRVAQAERRIIEAARMGFTSAYVAHTVRLKRPPQGIEIVPVATVSELLRLSLGIEASDTVGAPAVIPASPEAPHWKERGDKASSRAGKRAKRDPWRANRTSVSDE